MAIGVEFGVWVRVIGDFASRGKQATQLGWQANAGFPDTLALRTAVFGWVEVLVLMGYGS